jgi:hypothetical protein
MLDNQLISLIKSTLQTGLTAIGQGSIVVKQAYQPTQQGTNISPTLYLSKIMDMRFGAVERTHEWDADNLIEVYTETQRYITTFQVNALATQNPSNTASLTASDIVNYAAAVLESLGTIQLLRAQGVGIFKIGQIRNPYFKDERDRFEASPSFDFVLSHNQVIVSQQPIITETELQVLRV